MTLPRPYRAYREKLPEEAERWLRDGVIANSWYYLSKVPPKEIWHLHKDRIVHEWAEHSPGSRPRLFWRWEAKEMRKRLGGSGTPLHDCGGAYVPHFEYGVPASWCREEVTLPSPGAGGRSSFPHSLLHPLRQHRAYLAGTPISESDPPRYESEASYLERLNLWLPGEKACVKRADWLPVVVRYRPYPKSEYTQNPIATFPQWEVCLHRARAD